jgi:hypothetical protein
MSKSIALSLLNCAINGDELLRILDSIVSENDDAQSVEDSDAECQTVF